MKVVKISSRCVSPVTSRSLPFNEHLFPLSSPVRWGHYGVRAHTSMMPIDGQTKPNQAPKLASHETKSGGGRTTKITLLLTHCCVTGTREGPAVGIASISACCERLFPITVPLWALLRCACFFNEILPRPGAYGG